MTEPSYFAWISNGDFTLDTKRQFALLKEKYDEEKRAAYQQRKAAENRPLTDDEFGDALSRLNNKFGGQGSLF
jgi:DNA polymerase-3 subunit epsilon